MVNAAVQGKQYPPTAPYLVGREKVREFARAVLNNAPIHHDASNARAAAYADVVAPPSFAIVIQDLTLRQLLADEEAALDFTRVVHGDQRFSFTRPIVAGDELTAQMTVASVKQLGGNSLVTSRTEVTDPHGAHVVTAVSTLVERAANTETPDAHDTSEAATSNGAFGLAVSAQSLPTPNVPPEQALRLALPTAPVFEQLRVAEILAEREFHFSRDTLVRYAGTSGDFNPIHYRDDVARAAQLPGVIAHGMLTMGVAAAPVSEWLGAAGEVRDYQTRFTRPIVVDARVGATLTVTATIGALDPDARTAQIHLRAVCAERTVLGKSQVLVAFR